MIRLSVNVNKFATLRNSRTRQPSERSAGVPSVTLAARTALEVGCRGITVHPRGDGRHITTADVLELSTLLAPLRDTIEFNIEGDPRPELVALVERVRPHQFTIVPVATGEITSSAGWASDVDRAPLIDAIRRANGAGARASIFVDAEIASVEWAASLGAQRVELFTEPYAQAHAEGPKKAKKAFERCVRAAERAHTLGLDVNAGHDLDLENLLLFRTLPHLVEVSIGHALVARSLFHGFGPTVRTYLDVLAGF